MKTRYSKEVKYHPKDGYKYGADMTPEIDWELIKHVKVPEGRWFNEKEMRQLFVLSHRLTPENIELMKKWDKDNNRKDRFTPHHNGLPDYENKSKAFARGGDKDEQTFFFGYLTGKYSQMDLNKDIFERELKKEWDKIK